MRWPIVGLLLLTGCVAFGNEQQQIIAGCEGYAATLVTLSALKADGRLTPEQINTVDTVRPVLNSICDGQIRDVPGTLDVLQTELIKLLIIEKQIQ